MRARSDGRDGMRLKLFWPLLAVLFYFALTTAAMAQAPMAGSISSASGAVQIQRASGLIAATSGTPVNIGDRIITGAGGHAVITLTDGSQLEVGESSNMTIDNHVLAPAGGRAETKVSLFGGVLRSVVSATGGTPNFEVHTPNAVAAVRGTDFLVSFSDGQRRFGYPGCETFTDISVVTGAVAVANMANPNVTVSVPEGFSTTVACGQAPLPPGPSGLENMESGGLAAPGAVTAPPPGAAPAPAPPPPAPPPPGSP